MGKGLKNDKGKSSHLLVDALDSFNTTVSDLGSSYQELKDRIRELNIQISEKNRNLERNFFEVNRLRWFFDSILNSLSDGVVVVDTNGKVVLFNAGAEKLTGFSSEDVLGKSYSSVFGRQVSHRFSPLYTLEEGLSLYLEEKEIETRSGECIPVRFSTGLVTDSQNQILGAVEVLSDLSKIRWFEETMQQIKTQAALNQMAGLVANEIRNPLGGIRGYIDLLDESLSGDDSRKEMLQLIRTSIKRLDDIVKNFLLYAKPVKPNYVESDLAVFLKEVIVFFKQKINIDKKNIHLDFRSIPKEKSIKLRIDPIIMEQALFVILDNSIKAMKEGGILRVECQDNISYKKQIKDGVSIIISDSGEGMPKQVLDQVFTPFFTTRDKGMGLGLSLARNFISLHQGEIFIESQKGMGTTVSILLPKT
jgi:PAS domain S-box-containing protein